MTQEHHFYATFALGWQTGSTRQEAIEKLVGRFRKEFREITKNCQKQGDPGAYIWTCRVNAPADAEYRINFYAPVDVETEEAEEHFVTYVTKNKIAYTDGVPK